MNDNSFPPSNGGPYNLSEIWQVPINSAADSSGGARLEMHRPSFGADLSHFAAEAANRDVTGNNEALGGGRKRRDVAKEEEVDEAVATANAMNENMSKRLKTLGSGGESQHAKEEDEGNTGKGTDQGSKQQSDPLKDYIHVRARRGQATDSHSLAERARREKISDRMKTLQDLVPGCNKVIGKAMVLDEIINYVQSLQQQVEFLSMKLEAVNSRMNVGLEGYPMKNFGQQQAGFDPSGGAYGPQAPEEHVRGSSPEWLHMQVGSGFER